MNIPDPKKLVELLFHSVSKMVAKDTFTFCFLVKAKQLERLLLDFWSF